MRLELADHPALLEVVDLDHRCEKLEVGVKIDASCFNASESFGNSIVCDQTCGRDERVRARHLE